MKEFNEIHCTICNQIINTTKPLLAKDYTVSGETFSIFKCDNCQYGFTHPQPSPDNIGKYYSSPDYSPHANYVKNVTDVLYNVARTFNVKNKVQLVKTFAKTQGNINIADIGCGNGHFLQQCKKEGMIVQGVEVNQQAKNITEKRIGQKIFQSVDELIDSVTGKINDCRQGKLQKKLTRDEPGDPVTTGKINNDQQGKLQKELSREDKQMIFFVNQGGGGSPFDDVDNRKQALNVITLWHVLEHLFHPEQVLLQLLDLLTPTGIIILALPNYLAHDAQHYQQHWAAYDTPRHLSHFTKKTINYIAKQCNAKVVDVIPMKLDALYVSILSEKYKGNNNTIALAKGLRQGIISNYYAKKTGESSSIVYVLQKNI